MSRYIAIFSSHPKRLLALAPHLSPKVEFRPPHGLIVEVPARYEGETLHRLTQLSRGNEELRVGVASTRATAVLAAVAKPGVSVPPGKEREFLEVLPLDLFSVLVPLTPEVRETLVRWGIRTLGELASLPGVELSARLGQEGLRLQQLARGEEILLPQPYTPPLILQESRDLDWALDSLESLSFILTDLLETLGSQLRSRGLAAESVELRLQLANGRCHRRLLRLSFPTGNARTLLSLLRLDLQSQPPQGEICSVSLQIQPVSPRLVQYSLLDPGGVADPEELSRTLSRLKALVGNDAVGCPRLLDTHRPDAFAMSLPSMLESPAQGAGRRGGPRGGNSVPCRSGSLEVDRPPQAPVKTLQLSLRRMRPPLPLLLRGDQILCCAGPWRSSGDWWKGETEEEGWSRDEWDIEMTDGSLYRIYWDQFRRRWFLEGIYD